MCFILPLLTVHLYLFSFSGRFFSAPSFLLIYYFCFGEEMGQGKLYCSIQALRVVILKDVFTIFWERCSNFFTLAGGVLFYEAKSKMAAIPQLS
jgi:hypothetical protein